jgi:manganese/zinc/iron transport system ATP- binding protein
MTESTIELTERSTKSPSHDDCLLIEDLTVAYGRRVVLSGVTAEIRKGQIVGVIGPNGGGKTTLLKAILGVIPTISGRISLFGAPADKMRSHMACVPQREAVDWDFPVTVRDVVMMGRYPRGRWPHRPGRRDRQAVEDALTKVDMLSMTNTQIGQLSGGQQQRVFMARALVQEADVLLLDEPMAGIDAATQEIILGILETESRAGKIVLMATHDLVSASCACDCLCCVNERMISYGPVAETYTADNLAETFGGPVIILGQRPTETRLESHAVFHTPHHDAHVHENLGREHD